MATAIEALAAISPLLPVESLRAAQAGERLQVARACYSHLGGSLAVTITRRLTGDGVISPLTAGQPSTVHELDHPLLAALGVTLLPAGSGPAVRGCLDWTEHSPHLAGRLGSAVMSAIIERKWLARRPRDRALTVTALGEQCLGELLRAGCAPCLPGAGKGKGEQFSNDILSARDVLACNFRKAPQNGLMIAKRFFLM